MAKIFLDTEFTGLHKNTTLISMGLISKCGKTFYAEFTDYDKTQINDWLRDNVIANLHHNNETGISVYGKDIIDICANKEQIRKDLLLWLSQFDSVQIWSDCLSYDWVLFNDIFGHAFNLPENISCIPMDICTLFEINGIDPDITREEFINHSIKGNKHNALYDAKVIKACYEKLISTNKMKNKLNPYHELTELYDPFGIFGIQSILFESFKKVMFAGCLGRKKGRKRDLKEAKYSIERAIRMIENEGINGRIEWIDADYVKLLSVKYIAVTHNGIQFALGMELLEFCRTGKIKKLKKVAAGIGRMLNDFQIELVANDLES